MGGGLMQLVAYGAQDVYLTGNPQITYFKVVYRRHTNFSMECIELPLDSANFGKRNTVQVLRNGDLATRMYIRVILPEIDTTNAPFVNNDVYNTRVAWVKRVGHALINNIELTIGGSQIDKHWGNWMDIWYELTHTVDQERGYRAMIGDVPELTELRGANANGEVILPEYELYIPLQFSFNRNTGLALPLIALQYHEVRFNIEFNTASELLVSSGVNALSGLNQLNFVNAGLMVDYIYLDSEERRRMAQVGHEYLIEQLQYNSADSTGSGGSQKHKLEFNHPTKEIVFVPQLGCWNVDGGGQAFLTYSGERDEDSAVEYGAQNVGAGMFIFAEGAAATTLIATSNWTQLTLPIVNANSSSYVKPTTGVPAGIDITVLVNNIDTVASPAGYGNLYVNNECLGNNSVFLADKISSVLVTITINNTTLRVSSRNAATGVVAMNLVTATQLLLPTDAVTVISHSLTLADLSVPVDDLDDARAEAVVSATAVRDVTVQDPTNYGLDLNGNGNLVRDAQLKLNGHDRFDIQNGPYFNYVQPYQHHTRTPADGVNVYSFALNPEQHQPSGSANLSRIDTTLLNVFYKDNLRTDDDVQITSLFSNSNVNIYAFSYNVLRIMSGMGGLAYAN
jgi:hypothetical protein